MKLLRNGRKFIAKSVCSEESVKQTVIESRQYEAVVIGVSAGGLTALHTLFAALGKDFLLPILIVQHISPTFESRLPMLLNQYREGAVKEAEDKDKICAGGIYIAPPNYHLLVEPEKSIALSLEERVNYSRPSIDVLFETASEAYGERLIGVILTGANSDGAIGLSHIKKRCGLTIVQAPESAEFDAMPKAAIATANPDFVLPLDEIGSFLNLLGNRG